MQLLDMATFPGAARRQVYELGEAIAKAAVETDEISGPITASK